MKTIALSFAAAAALLMAPSFAGAQTAGGTVQYSGTVMTTPRQNLSFGSFLPGVGQEVALTNTTQRGQYGVSYNARSIVSISMTNNGRLTQTNPETAQDGTTAAAGHFTPVYSCQWASGDANGPTASGPTGTVSTNCFGSAASGTEMDVALNPDGRLTYRWILLGGTFTGGQTATQPAGDYSGTVNISIRRFTS